MGAEAVIGKLLSRFHFDIKLLAIVFALLGVGLPMVLSSSHLLAYREYEQATYFLQRQVMWALIGMVVMLIVSFIPYTLWRRLSIVSMVGVVLTLLAILIFASLTNGARRWFVEGSIQPSELAKLITIFYIAHWLTTRKAQLQDISYGLIPFYAIIGVVAGLVIVQPDLSTGLVIVFTALAMFYVAGAPIVQLGLSSVVLGGLVGLTLIVFVPWRLSRFMIFMDPLKDKTGDGYQIYNMLRAMSSGGWFGNGFSSLTSNIGYLPASHTDAIFAVIGNDFGLVGGAFVVALFGLLAWRGLHIAEHAPDAFSKLLATGITAWLIVQALLNIASTTASIPFTGIPLPFISFGGSALVSAMAGVGVLLNIARVSHKQAQVVELSGPKRARKVAEAKRARVAA